MASVRGRDGEPSQGYPSLSADGTEDFIKTLSTVLIARMMTPCQPGRPNFFFGHARSIVKVGVAAGGKP